VGDDTREAILDAARSLFSEVGYRRATLRAVGAMAGVDPRLVLHYFGSKRGLFTEAVRLPFDAGAIVESVFGAEGSGRPASRSLIGERVAWALLGILEETDTRGSVLAILRAATSEPEAAEIIRGVLTRDVLTPLAARIGSDRPELRASFLGAAVVGLAMARYVVAIEPLASASPEQVVRALAPVIAHYLRADWILEEAQA